MKALIPLLVVSTSALAVTTVQFAQRASTERKRADDAVALSQKHEARIRELEKMQSVPATAERPAALVESATMLARGAAPVPQLLRERAVPPQSAPLTRAEAAGLPQVLSRSYGPMNESPAAQRYMQTLRKASMRRQYADVGQALGLSQEQANKLIDLLSDPQSRMIANSGNAPMDRANIMQAAAEAKKRTDAAVAAVIGQDKVPQWEEYQKTMPERVQASMVHQEMQRMGMPLSDDQRARLVDILVEQHQQNPRPAPEQGIAPEEMRQASMKWQDESDKEFLERAKSVLTNEQYEQYRDYQEWQREMRNDALRNFRSAMPVNQSGQAVIQQGVVVQQGAVGLSSSSAAILVPAPPPESPSNK